jgi:hypothetical protein
VRVFKRFQDDCKRFKIDPAALWKKLRAGRSMVPADGIWRG